MHVHIQTCMHCLCYILYYEILNISELLFNIDYGRIEKIRMEPVDLTMANAAESVERNGKKSYKPFPEVLTDTRSSIL